MKTLEFNKGSWHYFLADVGSKNRINNDICGYGRQMLGGACIVIVTTLICACLLAGVGMFLGETVAALVTMTLLGSSAPATILTLLALGVGCTALYYIGAGSWVGVKKLGNISVFSAIKEAHDNKICLPIKFTNKGN